MDVQEILKDRLDELRGFLAKDPFQNLFALGMLEEHGLAANASHALTFHGLFDGGKVAAAVLIGGSGGLVIPCAPDPALCSELGQKLAGKIKIRGALGERACVDAFVKALGTGPAAWSKSQKLLAASADDLGPFVAPGLRQAIASDLPQLVELSAAALKESLGEDPLAHDPGGFTRRVEARITAGRTWVLPEGEKIVVKIDVGARSRYGAELEGLYTAPQARRRGLATLAMGQVCRSLLSSLPRLSMRVDEKELGLAGVCRKVGFSSLRPQRVMIAA